MLLTAGNSKTQQVTAIAVGVVLSVVGVLAMVLGYYAWHRRSNKTQDNNNDDKKSQATATIITCEPVLPKASHGHDTTNLKVDSAEASVTPDEPPAAVWPRLQGAGATQPEGRDTEKLDTASHVQPFVGPTEYMGGLVPFRERNQDLAPLEPPGGQNDV